MLYSRNGMTAAQKYEAIQAISSQLTDHARTGSRRGARPLMDVMEDWLDELEGRFDPNSRSRGLSTGIPHLMRCYSQKGLYADPCWLSAPVRKWGKPRFTANWPSTARCMKTCRPSCSVWKCRTSKSSNAW
jgi:replicative DNA helicase